MESNIYYDLAQTKLALDAAEHMIRRQKGKLFGKNLIIAGSMWLFWETMKILDKVSKELKQEKERANAAEVALAEAQMNCCLDYKERVEKMDLDPMDEKNDKDICCDGKANITKNNV